MTRLRLLPILAAVALAASACSDPAAPLPAETFTGSWRSITKSYEHLRLTVAPNAAVNETLQMRLTFSGVAWEGVGHIEADSLVMDYSTAAVSGASIVARPAEQGALSVRIDSDTTDPMTVTFVRDE
jgi:hypothetical protein